MTPRERLEHLCVILDRVTTQIEAKQPKVQFDLRVWAVMNDCETTACAWGWASLDEKFQKEGVTPAEGGFPPVFEGIAGFKAAERFFQIDFYTALGLFSDQNYPPSEINNPRAVIERVKQYLQENPAHV